MQFIKRWKISCNLVSDVAQGSLVFYIPSSDLRLMLAQGFPSQYLHVYWNTAPLVKTFNACISTTEDIFMCIILVNIEFCIWAGWFWPLPFFFGPTSLLKGIPLFWVYPNTIMQILLLIKDICILNIQFWIFPPDVIKGGIKPGVSSKTTLLKKNLKKLFLANVLFNC